VEKVVKETEETAKISRPMNRMATAGKWNAVIKNSVLENMNIVVKSVKQLKAYQSLF
jgi:CO dehydrogenase/acetyl-CoA synthase gamma subunit (corrinoid Fe-S protein)